MAFCIKHLLLFTDKWKSSHVSEFNSSIASLGKFLLVFPDGNEHHLFFSFNSQYTWVSTSLIFCHLTILNHCYSIVDISLIQGQDWASYINPHTQQRLTQGLCSVAMFLEYMNSHIELHQNIASDAYSNLATFIYHCQALSWVLSTLWLKNLSTSLFKKYDYPIL